MKKKIRWSLITVTLLGSTMVFNGCLSADFFKRTLEVAVTHGALEFLLDDDGVFDLFEDGATALNP
jgi:hypothetical protein